MPQDETARRLLYGRRRGHRLSPHQQRLFDELLPRLAIDPAEVAAHGDVVLEIGFGGGEHLAYRAVARPATLHLGCEPFENGVASLLARIDAEGISNIRLHCGDARETLAMLPDAALRRIDILYPDPWPKRRHRKRRFFGPDTLSLMARCLKPGGEVRFATDIDNYAAWTLARIAADPAFEWEAQGPADWLEPWEGWPGTRYEAKAKRAGRVPSYLTFRRS